MSGLLLVLLLGGVTLEVAGLVVTFRELRSRARAAVDFENRPVTHYVSAHATVHLSGSGTLSTRHVPTLEQRVDALEARVDGVRDDLTASIRAAEERANKTAGTIAEDIRRQVEDQVAAVAVFVLTSIERGRRAYIGPALFVAGLLLQTASSVLQIVA